MGNLLAASGRTGSSPVFGVGEILRKYLEGESSATVLFGCRLSEASGGEPLVCHTPDRSGLPSEVRGAAAERFTFPSRVRGISGAGWSSHWSWRLYTLPQT